MKHVKRLSVIILAMALVVIFSACGGQTPSDSADNFLKALKAGDKEKIAQVYEGNSFNIIEKSAVEEMSEDFQNLVDSKLYGFDYEISDEKIDGDRANVKVIIRTYSIGDAMSKFFGEYLSQGFALSLSGASEEKLNELAEELFTAQLENLKEKDFKKTAALSLTRKDGTWIVDQIEEDSDFFDAITGGVISSIDGLEDSFGDFLE